MKRFVWPTNGALLMSTKFTLFRSCRRHAVYSEISATMLSSTRQKELAWRGRSKMAVVLQGSVGWAGGLLPPRDCHFLPGIHKSEKMKALCHQLTPKHPDSPYSLSPTPHHNKCKSKDLACPVSWWRRFYIDLCQKWSRCSFFFI